MEAIRGFIGKVVKLDFQTDNRIRGHFARLAVFLNLEKPLISQVLVDGAVQRVEYEVFLTIYFGCGKYGHVKDLCPIVVMDQTLESPSEVVNIGSNATTGGAVEETWPKFNLWMLVERRSRRGLRNARGNTGVNNGAKFRKESLSSRFSALKEVRETSDNHAVSACDSLLEKRAEINSKGVVSFSTRVRDKSLGVLGSISGPSSGDTLVPIFDGVLDPRKYSAISFKDTSHKKEKITSINLSRKRLGNRISISKERHEGRDSNGRSSRKASNALCGRGSHFKASENSRVSLAESMEEMAKFISNSNISNDLNSDSDDVALILDGDTVS
ncbi:hypothetical protein GOBAR_DD03251 [Gossypium barbadense]|nr:hypothetical protein GOBAR_DD03251 [Gossypium barbadense]